MALGSADSADVVFGVLGAPAVRHGDASTPSTPVSGRLQRTLLAVLVMYANRPVSTDVLTDALWPDTPDVRGPEKLHQHVHRLRRTLDRLDRVSFGPAGYRLEVSPDEVDATRFEALADRVVAEAADDPARGATLARQALALWRGEPYEGLDVPILRDEARRLDERRLVLTEQLYEAELARGRHAAVVAELTDLANAHPLRERLHGLLMTALYLGGRQADALDAYRRARRILVTELGIEPGPELRGIERRILAGEPIESGRAAARTPVPAQLPPTVPGFTGGARLVASLDSVLALPGEPGGRASTVPVVVLAGTAGVGKTALALRWAHQVRTAFPDGQLYVDLRGYGPDEAMRPDEAVAGFLRELGVDGGAMPTELAERVARFRTLTDGRRMLVVLDNAQTAEQVRQLLPGSPSCFVLVTSRDSLAGVVATHGAHRVDLDRLTAHEAVGLLGRLVDDRIAAEPEAAVAVAQRCAYLPLTLRITAELLRARPNRGVADLLEELADEQDRLDLFDSSSDPHAAARAVFSWSYRRLDPVAARLFRLLGLHPARELDVPALTALAGADPRVTRRGIDTLIRAHLVEESAGGRYQQHDLLRAYAAELAERTDTAGERRAALTRMCDYFARTASAAMDVVEPRERDLRPATTWPTWPAGPGPVLTNHDSALRWLEAEYANLLAIAEHSADQADQADQAELAEHGADARSGTGSPSHATHLSATLWRFLHRGGHLDDARWLHDRALTVARRRGDRVAEANALRELGFVASRIGPYQRVPDYLEPALALYREFGDRASEGFILNTFGATCHGMGRPDDAITYLEQALRAYEQGGHRQLCAGPLANLGYMHRLRREYAVALDCFERGLVIARDCDDVPGQAYLQLHLACLCRDTGKLTTALEHARSGLALARARVRILEGELLEATGSIYCRLGDIERALRHHEQSLALARAGGYPDAIARSLCGLAQTYTSDGKHHDAIALFDEALTTVSDDHHERALAHRGLGDAHDALGEPDAAREHWHHALRLYREIGVPEADDVAARLAGAGPG